MSAYRDYLDTRFGAENWFKAEDLYDRMAARARGRSDVCFVELGAHLGRSACYMAEAILAAGATVDFATVDRFDDPDIEARCRANLEPYVTHGLLKIMKSDSASFAAAFPHAADFVFIDAGHDYTSVKADIEAWWPKVKEGGTIAGDDFWLRETSTPLWAPSVYPIWRAVHDGPFGGDYELMVRRGWAIWWKEKR